MTVIGSQTKTVLDPPGVDRRSIHDRAAAFADTSFRSTMEATA